MGRGRAKLDTRGPLQRFVDAEKMEAEQSLLNVLTPEMIAQIVSPVLSANDLREEALSDEDAAKELQSETLSAYGGELRVFGNITSGRRFFRLKHLDRLHKNGKLTHQQHAAGTWYRDEYDRGRYDAPTTQNLHRTDGGNVVQITSHDYMQDARDRWRAARTEWPRDMIGFMDAFLLHDRYPRRHHRASMRQLADVRRALDAMAKYLRLT